MEKLKNYTVLLLLLLAGMAASATGAAKLPIVTLKGDEGGTVTGKSWNSDSMRGKPHLVLYTVPSKKGEVTPLIERIDLMKMPPGKLGTVFIVNTESASIPDFIIKRMMNRRAQANPHILHLMDRKRVLVKKWGLGDKVVNVLLMDAGGIVVHRHAGMITGSYINDLMARINAMVKR